MIKNNIQSIILDLATNGLYDLLKAETSISS